VSSHQPMDFYRRDMQKTYVNSLGLIVAAFNQQVRESDMWTVARRDLLQVYKEVNNALPAYRGADLDHLQTIKWRIERILNVKLMFN
jgi:hypothetical protein